MEGSSRVFLYTSLLGTLFFGAVLLFGNFAFIEYAGAQTSSRFSATEGRTGTLTGFAWSENIGWISFSCESGGVCRRSPYGVRVDENDELSGYAWSETLGWLSFDEDTGCPQQNIANTRQGLGSASSCGARIDRRSKQLVGWARFLNGKDNTTLFDRRGAINSSSGNSRADTVNDSNELWDGWVHFSGNEYGVDIEGCRYSGWAWGSDLVGWIQMRGTTQDGEEYGVVGTGKGCMRLGGAPVADANVISFSVAGGSSIPLAPHGADMVEVAFGEEVNLAFSGAGSSDPDGWSDSQRGVADGGKCQWNSDLSQDGGSFTHEERNKDPISGEHCRASGVYNFRDAPPEDGSFFRIKTYDVLRIVDTQGLTSNLGQISVKIFYPAEITSFLVANKPVPYESGAVLQWTTNRATSCTIDNDIGVVSVDNDGIATMTTDALTRDVVYTLTCQGDVGQSVRVALPVPVHLPAECGI